MNRTACQMSHPAACLAYHTRVRFTHKGVERIGYTSQRNLNPHRKPGIGRVSYNVFVEIDGRPSGFMIRNVPADGIEILPNPRKD